MTRPPNYLFPFKTPWELTDDDVDEQIRAVVSTINGSEWVWTAACCAGHAEARQLGPGIQHVFDLPYLVLVLATADLPRLLLAERQTGTPPDAATEGGVHYLHTIRPFKNKSGGVTWDYPPEWFAVSVYPYVTMPRSRDFNNGRLYLMDLALALRPPNSERAQL